MVAGRGLAADAHAASSGEPSALGEGGGVRRRSAGPVYHLCIQPIRPTRHAQALAGRLHDSLLLAADGL